MIEVDSLDGFVRLTIQNDWLCARFLPEIGGKMISFRSQNLGKEFLLPSQLPGGSYRKPGFGAPFHRYDTSGYDECFPTIAPCEVPEAPSSSSQPVQLPDHGELWSIPWQWEVDGDDLHFWVEGKLLPYRFQRRVTLRDRQLIFHYRVKNIGKKAFHYLWSGHPLCQVVPGDQIWFSDPVARVKLEWTRQTSLGQPGALLNWPFLAQDGRSFATVQPASSGQAIKCFTPRLQSGCAGIFYPRENTSLSFHFDATAIPYLGLWLCYGGWPPEQEVGHLTVALEPCTAQTDSLQVAVRQGQGKLLAPDQVHSWEVRWEVHAIPPGNALLDQTQ